MSEDNFNPTAPSTAQEAYTTSSIPSYPSFQFSDKTVAIDPVYVSVRDPPPLSSGPTYPKNTVDQVPVYLTSYLQDEKYWTAFSSHFFCLAQVDNSFQARLCLNIFHCTQPASPQK